MVSQFEGFTLAQNAGLSDANARVASAIMMAESGGNASQITNDSDDLSYGLWQINMKGSMGPTRRALYGLKSDNDLLDPVTNARVMSAISHQGRDFSAWTTYTSGKYKKFIPTLTPEQVSKLTGLGIPGMDKVTGIADAVETLGNAVTKTAGWVSNPKNWVRVAYVIGGGILVYAAVETLILPYSTKAVGAIMGAGKKATP